MWRGIENDHTIFLLFTILDPAGVMEEFGHTTYSHTQLIVRLEKERWTVGGKKTTRGQARARPNDAKKNEKDFLSCIGNVVEETGKREER